MAQIDDPNGGLLAGLLSLSQALQRRSEQLANEVGNMRRRIERALLRRGERRAKPRGKGDRRLMQE